MKLTINFGKVSLLALILAGGLSATSFEHAYGAKEEKIEKKDEIGSDFKKDDLEKADDKKGDDKKEGKGALIESKEKDPKGFVDKKLTVSKEEGENVTRVKDDFGKEALMIDLREQKIIVKDPVLLQELMQRIEKGRFNPGAATVTVTFMDDGLGSFDSSFTKGQDGGWTREFNIKDPIVSDILRSPLAEEGKVLIEMKELSPEFLSKVESDVWSPEFSARHKAWGAAYARIAGIEAYIGAIDRIAPLLREREPGAYGLAGEMTAFKGVGGGKSIFDSRKGVLVMGTEEARDLWSMMAAKEPAMITLDLPGDDWRARQILEGYGLKESIMLGERAVYDLSQNPGVMKRIMEENALGGSASWIFKMNTAEDVGLLRKQWADKFGFNVMTMNPMMEPRPGSKNFGPEYLAKLDYATPDLDGWIKDGDTLGYKGGVGSFIYEKENDTLAVFDLTTAGHLLDRIVSDPYRAKATMDIIIDDLRYPGFRNRYLQDVDYVVDDEGKLSFQGLSFEKAKEIVDFLPFYKADDPSYERGFSRSPVTMALNGMNFELPANFSGRPDEFFDYLFEGRR